MLNLQALYHYSYSFKMVSVVNTSHLLKDINDTPRLNTKPFVSSPLCMC